MRVLITSAVLVAVLLVPVQVLPQPSPAFFFDFDEDGISDTALVSEIDLGLFQPATLYIGVFWPDHDYPDSMIGLAAAEYQVRYAGMVPPPLTTYSEPGDPPWALNIGSPLAGGWFHSGPCRGVHIENGSRVFIATISVIGTGSLQSFHFVPTSEPYEFPGLLQVYDCSTDIYLASVLNSADCIPDPNPVAEVTCEPQDDFGNRVHPPSYWYDVTVDGFCAFHVRVEDPEDSNYSLTTFRQPSGTLPASWTYMLHRVGDEWWMSWWDSSFDCQHPIYGGMRFAFENPSNEAWGDWSLTFDGSPNPYWSVIDASWNHSNEDDGYGYRVHVPVLDTAVRSDNWGNIKSMFR